MKKKFYAPYPDDATSFYRGAGVLPYIGFEPLQGTSWSHLIDTDVLLIQRPCEPQFIGLMHLCKNMGIKTILDYDDDVLNVDMDNPAYGIYIDKTETIKELLSLADEVWCSTESVQGTLMYYNPNCITIPNAHNDFLFPIGNRSKFNEGSKVAYWRGGMTHEADIYEKGRLLADFINAAPEWQWYFIGHRFLWLEQQCGNNYNIVPEMHLMSYFNFLYSLKPEIMIYPLRDTALNRGKSNIAWMEATYVGAVLMGDAWRYPEGCVADWEETVKSEYHERSWAHIEEHLLLSKINELREERLIKL